MIVSSLDTETETCFMILVTQFIIRKTDDDNFYETINKILVLTMR